MNFKLVVGVALVGLVALFTFQNAEIVEVRFLFWKLSMSRALMIFFVLAVGILSGWLLHSWMQHKKG